MSETTPQFAICVMSEKNSDLEAWKVYQIIPDPKVDIVSNLKEIEKAILSLPSNDFEKLKQWFFDLDYQQWDEQIEQDIADDRLEAFAQEAISEFKAGHCQEI